MPAVAAAGNAARVLSAKNMRTGTDEHGRRIRMFTATLTCDRAEKVRVRVRVRLMRLGVSVKVMGLTHVRPRREGRA